MKFVGDVVITAPYYIIEDSEDYTKCNDGVELGILGINNFLSENDGYNDENYYVVMNTVTFDHLGEFSSYKGVVSVCLLSEIIKYDMKFDVNELIKEGKLTLIKDFNGRIIIDKDPDGYIKVIGYGNINFFSED